MHTLALERSLNTGQVTILERASSSNPRYLRKLLRWRVDRGVLQGGLLRGVDTIIDSVINTAEIPVGAC
jgi:hypothetical protein